MGEVDDFGAVLGTTTEHIEHKDQWKNISEKLKKYVLQYFHNHEDIIVLVRDRKTPMTVLNTSIHSALSTQDQKDPIIVMIQTKKIEQYVKNRSRLRQNIIRLYGLIWLQCLPALKSELESDPDYSWLFKRIKICTSGINHTSNGYYSAVMAMRDVSCLWQGQYEPTKD